MPKLIKNNIEKKSWCGLVICSQVRKLPEYQLYMWIEKLDGTHASWEEIQAAWKKKH